MPEELFPHLLAERSAKNPAVCPLCGSEREMSDGLDADGSRMRSWCCWTCHSDVKKAKKVLTAKRVNPDAKKRKAKKAKAATTVPTGAFGLPYLGEIDFRTSDEKAADKAAGIPDPVCDIPTTSKPKPKPKPQPATTPALHNRISGIA